MKLSKEKILKFLNMLRYPVEFIILLVFSTQLYKFITVKSYQGYWSKNILIGLIISATLSISILIYNCIKDKNKIEKMFINFAIPVGLLFIIFMLPTYTPDACAHIWKSYEISEGTLFTKKDDEGISKTTVPDVLSTYRENVLTKYNKLEEGLLDNDSNNYNKTVQVDSPAKGYCFIFYIGYAMGFYIAKTIGLNIFIAVYLAKIINFIIFLILSYWSIKKIPFGKLLLATYLMIPMMMQQATAVSVDCLMNAIIILFIAYTFNLAFKKENLLKKEKIIYLVLTAFIGFAKAPYLPIIAIGLIIAKRRKEMSNKEKIILAILTIIICIGSYFILNKINSEYTTQYYNSYLEENGVNSKEQISNIISNPIQYLKTLYNNLIVNGDFYIFSAIGDYMGWLSIKAPSYYSIMYIVLIVISIFIEKNEQVLKTSERIGIVILTSIMAILVVTGLYIEWTKVGANTVSGVQGRYFLPISILALLSICQKNNYIKIKNPNLIILLCSVFINILFIKNMILFFI